MTRPLQKLQEHASAAPNRMRVEALLRLPAAERAAVIEADLRSVPDTVSDEIVFHRKTLLRMWDTARLEAGMVTREVLQRENSPVTYEQMANAKLTFRPRLRA